MNRSIKTISWINTLKAYSIISVFFVHCQLYYGLELSINSWIYPYYVNAFFFVSGYLLFWKQLTPPKIVENRGNYIRMGGGKLLFLNIAYRIIVPSIIFSAIEFIPSCMIQGRGIDVSFALFKTIGGGTYWFTSALVVAELVLLLLFCSRNRNIWFYAVLCLALGITSLIIVRYNLLNCNVWMWKHGLIALIFLAMGGLYWRYEKQIDNLKKWCVIVPLLALYISVIMFSKHANPLISMLSIEPLGFLTSAVACLLLVWFCKLIPMIKPLTFIGQNSLGFYFLSGALPITFSMIAHKLTIGGSIWMMLAIWVACVVVAYIAVIFINRWLPWLWDLRSIKKTTK